MMQGYSKTNLWACYLFVVYLKIGCGKSTQVPQFLFDSPLVGPTCKIAVTQPRRISAVSVAERVSYERGESLGETVGFNIRLESVQTASSQIIFMTPGVLLRKLLNDPMLDEFTHVIVDEAHERDRFTEFLLIVLRDLCKARPLLRLLLMSATMHTDKLRSYFGDIHHISVGGSMYPVRQFHLEDVLSLTGYQSALPALPGMVGGAVGAPVSTTVIAAASNNNSNNSTTSQSTTNTLPRTSLTAVTSSGKESRSFFCAVCHNGPFVSAVLLGVHTAIACSGGDCDATAAMNTSEISAQVTSPSVDSSSFSLLERMQQHASSRANQQTTSVAFSSDIIDAIDSALQPQNEEAPLMTKQQLKWKAMREKMDLAKKQTHNAEALASGISTLLGPSGDLSVGSKTAATIVDTMTPLTALDSYQRTHDDAVVDYDLVVALLKSIVFAPVGTPNHLGSRGGILVFLPGWEEISQLTKYLKSCGDFGDTSKFRILQLHSGLPRSEQHLVFTPTRKGEFKIILSTNIAETSITIDDVIAVIDSGRAKEKTYDPHTKLAYLKTAWISNASATQRRGRAGRTDHGTCYRLYSARRAANLDLFQDSELMRMPLEELVLQV
jgi:hypothetical protein